MGLASYRLDLRLQETMPEQLEATYQWLWENTTGKPYTEIIREEPGLLIIPSAVIIFVTFWKLPRQYWARAVFLFVGSGIGFVSGHVFW